MSEPEQVRKHALECLRLEAACMQLAGDAPGPNSQAHFLRMAQVWSTLAFSKSRANADRQFGESRFLTETTDGGLSPQAILVVEDDHLLKSHAVDIVEKAGFVALEAGDADEAVAILESRSDIAMLFTDIGMPGSMDGLELAHAVHKRWPPIRIIVVSGAVRPAEHDLPPDSCFFGKPYCTEEMVVEIRLMIGAGLQPRP